MLDKKGWLAYVCYPMMSYMGRNQESGRQKEKRSRTMHIATTLTPCEEQDLLEDFCHRASLHSRHFRIRRLCLQHALLCFVRCRYYCCQSR
jgi:hypothetical protein